MRCTPIRHTPIRHTPMRFTPIRSTLMKYTPMRCMLIKCTLMRYTPTRTRCSAPCLGRSTGRRATGRGGRGCGVLKAGRRAGACCCHRRRECIRRCRWIPNFDGSVRVLDHGGEAVRVHLGDEGRLLELGGCPDLRRVGDGQLFEEKSDFPGVRVG